MRRDLDVQANVCSRFDTRKHEVTLSYRKRRFLIIQQITLGGIVVRRFLLAYRISRASEASNRLPFKF